MTAIPILSLSTVASIVVRKGMREASTFFASRAFRSRLEIVLLSFQPIQSMRREMMIFGV